MHRIGGVVLALAGCSSEPQALDFARWAPTALAWSEDVAVVSLPEPHRQEIIGPIPVSGPWTAVATNKGVRVWQAPMPVRLRTLFFHRPPHDMAVLMPNAEDGPQTLSFARGRKNDHKADTWSFNAAHLRVRRAASAGPPTGLMLRYSRGVERENDLTVGVSERSDTDMVFRSLQLGAETRRGVFLPGGTEVRLPVTIPEGAQLTGDVQLLPPEAADPSTQSDGAAFSLSIVRPTGEEELYSTRLDVGDVRSVRVDLESFAGTTAELVVRSDPGGSPGGDHVFFAEPRIGQPVEDPPRVVLVFVDTLRADGLSLYGYHRPTTPRLDAWASAATVFTQARSVAPWTLPSARAALSGAIPERWSEVPSLAERLGRAGWATSFFAGNVYLSSNFDMAEDWGLHRCVNWPGAEDQVDRALGWLDEHAHDPALLVLHLMDPHLPYEEPAGWRGRFAEQRPARFSDDSFLRGDVVGGRSLTAEEQAYVRGRYDNNVAWVDHQVDRLLSTLDEDDVVVVFSDHGEEFWEHGGFEHGHSLHEELLRVPLVVRAPGLDGGRKDQPVSLLDITPTVLAAVGLPGDGLDGLELQSVVSGSSPPDRILGFGRPLYGDRRWGALDGSQKYTTGAGKEQVFDLDSDPREQRPVRSPAAREAGRASLAAGHGWPVAEGIRVRPARGKTEVALRVRLPGGFSHAVVADDPTRQSAATATLQDDHALLHWEAGHRGTREIFLVPGAGSDADLSALRVEPVDAALSVLPLREPLPEDNGRGGALVMGRVGGRMVKVTRAVVPVPPTALEAVPGFDAEVEEELRALGYVD